MLTMSVFCYAQHTVTGTIVDQTTSEPVIGGAVMVKGTNTGTVTDIDGNFSIKMSDGQTLLQISYLGYVSKEISVTLNGNKTNIGTITLEPDVKALEDVTITSSVAVSRKTPVAMTSVTSAFIAEKLGTQEFPEVLKTTPGVYADKQGGAYGDSEIYMRGFDNTNIATVINGVPMNDMENGSVYWSNWAGLSDVTRTMQTQRGLGASKVSAPSVGGTINIITNGIEAEKGGFISYGMGNDNMNKIILKVSTGMTEKGWALTMLGSHHWGDGYVQGTDFDAYNWFINLSKRINDHHQLSITAFGAPQKHYQRNHSYGALTIEGWQMVEKLYGVKNYKYNASYGFDRNGKRKTADYNFYHKPQISLNHQWQIDNKSSLSTSVYVSIGRGGGYSGQASQYGGYTFSDWRGASYGELNTRFRKSDGTFDYGAIQELNEQSETGSVLVMTESKNYHNWIGLLSTYTTQFMDCIDVYGGVDFRYYKGVHTNEINDMFGGKYFIDSSRFNVSQSNNVNADTEWKNEKLGIGDVVYRDYDGYVIQEGLFGQAEYNKGSLSAFISASVSNTAYWRYDRFYYDETHAKSETVDFWGYTLKGGANYNLNDNHNVFVNIGTISRAPKFSNGAFMQSTSSNVINTDAKNEKIFSIEAGYGFKAKWMNANVNAYYTRWIDKTMTKWGTFDNQVEFFMNMTGVNAIHKGVEIETTAHPLSWLEINGMLSLGDWCWADNATGYIYNENGVALTSNGEKTELKADDHAWASINLKDIKVGGSAQTTAMLGASLKPMKGLKISGECTYFGNKYAYYAFNGANLSIGNTVNLLAPWKIPHACQVDLNASYRFEIGKLKATLYGNINNLFDYQYISKAYNPTSIESAKYKEANESNIYCFYALGRTYSVRLKVSF
jgi:outer membrane cobalamin receptor